jgi:hypothetical protein
MAQKTTISAAFEPADKEAVLKSIAGIKEKLGALLQVNLSPADRQEMPKMGEKTLPFVDKTLGYATLHPDLKPPYLDLDEAKRDYALAAELNEIARELKSLHQSVNDVLMVTGSEAYSAALMFYSSVKGASRSNVAGSRPFTMISPNASQAAGTKRSLRLKSIPALSNARPRHPKCAWLGFLCKAAFS